MKNSVLLVLPLAFAFGIGNADADTTVKIGVLSDLSSLYADIVAPDPSRRPEWPSKTSTQPNKE